MNNLPRLTKRELESLLSARKQLDAVYDTLGRTNLQAAPSCQQLLVDAAGAIDRILKKNLDYIARSTGGIPMEGAEAASEELGTGDEQGQGEISRQGEEE